MIPRFVAFLRRQPRWILIAIGLLWVAVLAGLDYVAPLELSFLTLYVAPVLFLVWFVGPAAGFLGAAVCAAFWIWEDVLSAHAHPTFKLHVTDWNLAVRAAFCSSSHGSSPSSSAPSSASGTWRRNDSSTTSGSPKRSRRASSRAATRRSGDWIATASAARPTGVAGDYYDFLPLEPGRTGIAVGDVAGKGLPAALLMASLQGSLRSLVTLSTNGPASLAADLEHPAPRPDGAEPLRHVLLGGLRRAAAFPDLGQRRPQRPDASSRRRAPSNG